MTISPKALAGLNALVGPHAATIQLLGCLTPERAELVVAYAQAYHTKPATTRATRNHVIRTISICAWELLYFKDLEPRDIKVHHTQLFLADRQRGPLKLLDEPLIILEQINAQTASTIGEKLDKFRVFVATGKIGKAVASHARPPKPAKSLATLPSAYLLLCILRHMESVQRRALTWLHRAPIPDYATMARIRPEDVRFLGPHQLAAITLRDANDNPWRLIVLSRAASWAIRVHLLQIRGLPGRATLIATVEGKPCDPHDMNGMIDSELRTHRFQKIFAQLQKDTRVVPITPAAIRRKGMVDLMAGGFSPLLLAEVLGYSKPDGVLDWHRAIRADQAQRDQLRRHGQTPPPREARYPGCHSCGHTVVFDTCQRCGYPQPSQDGDGFFDDDAGGPDDGKKAARARLEFILSLTSMPRDHAAQVALESLKHNWSNPP